MVAKPTSNSVCILQGTTAASWWTSVSSCHVVPALQTVGTDCSPPLRLRKAPREGLPSCSLAWQHKALWGVVKLLYFRGCKNCHCY